MDARAVQVLASLLDDNAQARDSLNQRRELWMRAYAAAMPRSCNPSKYADEALEAYDARLADGRL